MDKRLIFCDETENFRIPAEPKSGEPFVLRIWVPREEGISVSFLLRAQDVTRELKAQRTASRGILDVFEAQCPGTREEILYFASVRQDSEEILYGRNGIRELKDLIPFSVNPAFYVPAWARGAVWYQIFPDRFCNGDPSNDVETGEIFDDVGLVSRKMRWDDPVTALDVHHYYGGDLAGILKKLDYLKELGVDVLYLNPVFVAPSSHGYNTQDYAHVDPHLGRIGEEGEGKKKYRVRTTSRQNLEASDQVLAELIREAHKRQIRVVLDGVFNHCSSFHAWDNAGKLYPDRPVPEDYFRRSENGEKECWWGNKNLLKLNIDGSPALKEEILKIAEKWLKPPFGADGWRLDVAADVGHSEEANHRFWREFRDRVRDINPEALILAEHYGDPSAWLGGDEWDSVMNYDAFMDPVSWFLTGMEKHSDRYLPWMEGAADVFFRTMEETMARLPRPSLEASLCQLDNHDHSRFLTRTNHVVGRLGELGYRAAEQGVNKAILRAAVLLQMTWPGAPGIYYGDEAGLCGFTDPDDRRTYPWGREDNELIDYYENMTRIRRRYEALRTGSVRILKAEQGLLVYARFQEAECFLVVIHQGITAGKTTVTIPEIDGMGGQSLVRLILTDENGYNLGQEEIPLEAGSASLTLAPREAALFKLCRQAG